jgi:eukaryotic-like serine/threonine-protein kinase
MGEVYLAEDRRLMRKVALKILPKHLINETHRLARFEREARAASALNHPAILTIHELGRDGDIYYIAGEYVEGETLRDRMRRERMRTGDAVGIAAQIAAALAAAHAAGIVHRDIKPENIMLRPDGFVKVLDFGLAKLMTNEASDSGATIARGTDPGTVVGTVHYMSPEQARGHSIDVRSDIFSLGAVMYEMLTGRPPFEGQTSSHVVVSILERAPAPLTDVPAELQRIVSKTLEKDPDERYQTSKDLAVDLRHLKHELDVSGSGDLMRPSAATTASAQSSWTSIERLTSGIRTHPRAMIAAGVAAVLVVAALFVPPLLKEAESGERIPIAVADFDNQTGEKALDGLSGMLITSLEQSRRLSVMTRARMFDVLHRLGKGNVTRIDETVGREVAKAENMRGLVTASVSKLGDLYVIDMKVLDPSTAEYVFTGKEQGKGQESIPDLLDKLAERLRLAMNETSRDVQTAKKEVGKATTTNLQAYQHYFVADQKISEVDFRAAHEELKKAVALDPTFGQAWTRLAYVASWADLPEGREYLANARKYMADATEKEKMTIAALESEIGGDHPRAITLRRALLERFPDDKESIYLIGDMAFHQDDLPMARAYLQRTLELDPRHERAHQHLIWTEEASGNFAVAIDHARRYMRQPASPEGHIHIVQALIHGGLDEEALAFLRDVAARSPNSTLAISNYALTLGFLGQYDAARQQIERIRDFPEGKKRGAYEGMLAGLAIHRGRYREAAELMMRQAKICAANGLAHDAADAMAARALIIARAGRAEEARAAIEEVLAKKSDASASVRGSAFTLYILLGDIEKAEALRREISYGWPALQRSIDAARRYHAGDVAGAVEALKGPFPLFDGYTFMLTMHYMLAAGQYRELADFAGKARIMWPGLGLDIRDYYLGRAEEGLGNRAAAKAHYQSLLVRWRDADPDLPELVDAKARLSRL